MRCCINGVETEYERVGEGSPVLILHGWGACIDAVKPIAKCVASLGYEAVSLDFPGFGKSEEPPTAWTVRDYAAFTREFIRTLKLEGCDVVCHSFGGRVTFMLASEEPALFNRLVLVDAAGVRPKRGVKYYVKTYSYKLIKALGRIKAIDKAFGISERQKSKGSADYRALKSDVMRKTFVNVVNYDQTGVLSGITNDTLIVWGENDDTTPVWMAKLMEKRIKRAGLAVLAGAGHFSYADNYPQFCAVMKAYFTGR